MVAHSTAFDWLTSGSVLPMSAPVAPSNSLVSRSKAVVRVVNRSVFRSPDLGTLSIGIDGRSRTSAALFMAIERLTSAIVLFLIADVQRNRCVIEASSRARSQSMARRRPHHSHQNPDARGASAPLGARHGEPSAGQAAGR
jgi:hypothetical protein